MIYSLLGLRCGAPLLGALLSFGLPQELKDLKASWLALEQQRAATLKQLDVIDANLRQNPSAADVETAQDAQQEAVDLEVQAQRAFVAHFERVSLSRLLTWGNDRILVDGFGLLGQASLETEPRESIWAWETLLDVVPEGNEKTLTVRRDLLPLAYLLGEKPWRAAMSIKGLRGVPSMTAALEYRRGEALAMAGRLDDARRAWSTAMAAAESSSDPMDAFVLGQTRTILRWIGTRPQVRFDDGTGLPPVADGTVRVLHFSATWCAPCRENALAIERATRGGAVEGLAITQPEERVFVPVSPSDPHEGVMLEVAAEEFPARVAEHDRALGLSHSTRIVTDEEWARLGIQGVPLTLVLDDSGRVVFVAAAGGGAGSWILERAIGEARDRMRRTRRNARADVAVAR